MAFSVTIKPAICAEANLTEQMVTSVAINSEILGENHHRGFVITIKGIFDGTEYETLNLSQWALIRENEEWEANMEIKITDNDGKVTRVLNFTDVFVISYEESFMSKDTKGEFTLVVKQYPSSNDEVTLGSDYK